MSAGVVAVINAAIEAVDTDIAKLEQNIRSVLQQVRDASGGGEYPDPPGRVGIIGDARILRSVVQELIRKKSDLLTEKAALYEWRDTETG